MGRRGSIPRRRPGFTMIEVVVVIAVVGVLAALILPAVQSARESARRVHCINNLRQIGLSVHGYLSAAGVLPASFGGTGYSALTQILPYMEQSPLYNSVNQDVPEGLDSNSANMTSDLTQLGVYLCPSDRAPQVPVSFGGGTRSYGSTSYAMNVGYWPQKYGANGAFLPAYTDFPSGGITVRSVPPWGTAGFADGMSNTVALSEWTLGAQSTNHRDAAREVLPTLGPVGGLDELEIFAASCHALVIEETIPHGLRKGLHWIRGRVVNTAYTHVMGINDHSCINGPDTLGLDGAYTSGSVHRAGANVLFADGHTRFLKDTIAAGTWRALGSRAGGDISAPEL